MAIFIFMAIIAIWGVGFVAGYKGTWKHSIIAVGVILAIPITLQSTSLVMYSHGISPKAISGNLALATFAIFGSFVGALLAKKGLTKATCVLHLGLVAGSAAILQIFAMLGER